MWTYYLWNFILFIKILGLGKYPRSHPPYKPQIAINHQWPWAVLTTGAMHCMWAMSYIARNNWLAHLLQTVTMHYPCALLKIFRTLKVKCPLHQGMTLLHQGMILLQQCMITLMSFTPTKRAPFYSSSQYFGFNIIMHQRLNKSTRWSP